MSFDVFVQCFRGGEVATFKCAILEEIFGPYAAQRDPDGGMKRLPHMQMRMVEITEQSQIFV